MTAFRPGQVVRLFQGLDEVVQRILSTVVELEEVREKLRVKKDASLSKEELEMVGIAEE